MRSDIIGVQRAALCRLYAAPLYKATLREVAGNALVRKGYAIPVSRYHRRYALTGEGLKLAMEYNGHTDAQPLKIGVI